jgi:hypothetical protein
MGVEDKSESQSALERSLLALVLRDLAANWQTGLPNCRELRSAIDVLIVDCGYSPKLFSSPDTLDVLTDAFFRSPRAAPLLTIVKGRNGNGGPTNDPPPKAA